MQRHELFFIAELLSGNALLRLGLNFVVSICRIVVAGFSCHGEIDREVYVTSKPSLGQHC